MQQTSNTIFLYLVQKHMVNSLDVRRALCVVGFSQILGGLDLKNEAPSATCNDLPFHSAAEKK